MKTMRITSHALFERPRDAKDSFGRDATSAFARVRERRLTAVGRPISQRLMNCSDGSTSTKRVTLDVDVRGDAGGQEC